MWGSNSSAKQAELSRQSTSRAPLLSLQNSSPLSSASLFSELSSEFTNEQNPSELI